MPGDPTRAATAAAASGAGATAMGGSRLRRDVIWNAGALGVAGVASLGTSALIIATRGPSVLGIFSSVLAAVLVLAQVGTAGLQLSAIKHCAHAQDDVAGCGHIATAVLLLAFVPALLVGLVVGLGGGWAGEILGERAIGRGLQLAAPGLVLLCLNKVLLMVLNGARLMRAFAVLQGMRWATLLAGVAVLLALGAAPRQLPLAIVAAEAIVFAAAMLHLRRRLAPTFLRLDRAALRPWWARHLSFAGRAMPSGVLVAFQMKADVLLLTALTDPASVGRYAFAASIAEGVDQLGTVVRWNLDPLIGAAFARGDTMAVEQLAQRVRRVVAPVMLLVGVLVLAGAAVAMGWMQRGSWEIWRALAVLVAGNVVVAAYRPVMAVLVQAGRPGAYTLLVAAMVAVQVALLLTLIPIAGTLGAAIASAIVAVAQVAGTMLLARRLLGVRLF